ncbi:purine-nucleoside phosphorylase [Sediminitomix flava]|uniref:Uridine phosphorylase n=1 Tax=Sediminitomix flava TaxID=379075 RepID=A0A315ZUV9_SEDFL|nr:purine-nucleoside phosphorylase [Sediminitomix flava]PWJ39959.1 purine-nucleoside phosphorylase [Sediminitomix flava]
MSVHIAAKKGDIAESILLPGDPLRAKFIAENYLENPVCYNEVRGMLGFTGTYKGKRISVQGTGMGVPSIGIYSHELINEYGVKNLIRVGSCGSYQKAVNVKDLVLAQAVSTNSNFNHRTFEGHTFAPVADFDLLKTAYDEAQKIGLKPHVGNVFTSDIFYEDEGAMKKWQDHNVLAVEMEATALYTYAAKFGVRALAILTVSDSLVTHEALSSEDRQTSFTQMMEVALNTAIQF